MTNNQIIAIIPAAGKATRLGQLPFSKELYPIGFEHYENKRIPKPVGSYLLENIAAAGVSEFHFVIRNGKWDIPAYFGSGKKYDCNISYHVADYEYGVPFTVNQVYPLSKDKIVVLGFPDNLIKPKNAFSLLIKELNAKSDTSVALGLFPATRPEKCDLVDYDETQKVTAIKIKSSVPTNLKYAWVIAAWKPEFSTFLNGYVLNKLSTQSRDELLSKEYHLGDAIISAIQTGMKVQSVIFDEGGFIDIGTPEDLEIANLFNTEN
ncbi:MAG: sugar phosphate nucleotidyltransferase [Cyclobacteriaceae bacterium]|nr:sugar phosphate nucleotidyltransferase [Cyclobacteriaceae bacterium]MDH4297236.1 sugar phosphate nucleotidyltransferase [Cyclobacteriaceae bacterium]MDH5250821.1 sugar phosphate nucleotidyltransferase [Cyclobacteriaceae bacterium]